MVKCKLPNATYVLPVLLFGWILLDSLPLQAQKRGNPNWYVSVEPYLWLANIGGAKAKLREPGINIVGDVQVPVEGRKLKGSWALQFELGKGRVRGIVNLSRANQKDSGPFTSISDTTVSLPGSYDFSWTTGEFLGAVQIGSFKQELAIEIMAGGRYVRQEQTLGGTAAANISNTDVSETWVEPLLGGRFYSELGAGFWASFHGDIGGFGAGSKFTYSLGGELGLELFKHADITMRYDYQEVDYDNEKEGADRYLWNNGARQGWFFGLLLKR